MPIVILVLAAMSLVIYGVPSGTNTSAPASPSTSAALFPLQTPNPTGDTPGGPPKP